MLRILSALLLAPPVVAAAYFGAPYFPILVVVGFSIAAWEWLRLCQPDGPDRTGWLVVAAVAGALVAAALGHHAAAMLIALLGAAGGLLQLSRDRGAALWSALGALYLSAGGLGLIYLRESFADGREIVLWIFALVWATDTGAMAAGRCLGGPKLAPGISPKKTWAGLAGGAAAAALVGALATEFWAAWSAGALALASLGLALIEQAGDLLESSLKRRAGVKDSSQLIPGHGGLLDRIDGLLAVSLVVSLFYWFATFWTGAWQ